MRAALAAARAERAQRRRATRAAPPGETDSHGVAGRNGFRVSIRRAVPNLAGGAPVQLQYHGMVKPEYGLWCTGAPARRDGVLSAESSPRAHALSGPPAVSRRAAPRATTSPRPRPLLCAGSRPGRSPPRPLACSRLGRGCRPASCEPKLRGREGLSGKDRAARRPRSEPVSADASAICAC